MSNPSISSTNENPIDLTAVIEENASLRKKLDLALNQIKKYAKYDHLGFEHMEPNDFMAVLKQIMEIK